MSGTYTEVLTRIATALERLAVRDLEELRNEVGASELRLMRHIERGREVATAHCEGRIEDAVKDHCDSCKRNKTG